MLRRIAFAALLSGLGLAGCRESSAAVNLATTTCQTDEEIGSGAAAAPVAAASRFEDAIINGRAGHAYGALSVGLAAKITENQFDKLVAILAALGPYQGLRTEHVYRVVMKGRSPVVAICGNPPDPGRWVAVAAEPFPEQFHVVETARTRNNDMAITTWLVPDKGQWRIEGFHVGASSTGGKFASELLAMARKQRVLHHDLNAALLYATTAAMVDRGSGFQLGLAQVLRSDLGTFRQPAEIEGRPPFHWSFGGRSFLVDQVSVTGIGSKLYLILVHSDPGWNGNDFTQADRINRALIEGFRQKHPDYSGPFSGVVARLLRRDRSGGFGTVFDNQSGFRGPPASS